MILVLNSGSSTVKFRLVDLADPGAGTRGLIERIGEPGGPDGPAPPDHAAAMRQILDGLGDRRDAIRAVGHRVVHGGDRFVEPTVVDDATLAAIDSLTPLAPLHNPGAVAGIRAAREMFADVPHVAVFDTAFHAGLPAAAATYAIDADLAARHGVRRYGFHGISVGYVAGRAATLLGRPPADLRLIVLHLGNGASATAVDGGRSVETSMGLTPLEGLVMGTRCGDLDPAVPGHLHRVAGLTPDEVEAVLQHRSGLVGLCGAGDVRTVLARRADGDPAATLALDVYCHRIRKYVGAYHAVLGRLDAIVFTAGVGENSPEIRAESLAGLDGWGITVDAARNTTGRGERLISRPDGRVAVCVVPTDEEHAIAAAAAAVTGAGRATGTMDR